MTPRELIDYCLTFPAAYKDYPFDTTSAVMRHSANRKMFALISERLGRVYINLKCEPQQADFFRTIYKDVTPGWHMNKTHWNTVYMDGDVPIHELHQMISHSYELTKPKISKKLKRAE